MRRRCQFFLCCGSDHLAPSECFSWRAWGPAFHWGGASGPSGAAGRQAALEHNDRRGACRQVGHHTKHIAVGLTRMTRSPFAALSHTHVKSCAYTHRRTHICAPASRHPNQPSFRRKHKTHTHTHTHQQTHTHTLATHPHKGRYSGELPPKLKIGRSFHELRSFLNISNTTSLAEVVFPYCCSCWGSEVA